MPYTLSRESVEAGSSPAEAVSFRTLIDDAWGCQKFAQRLVLLAAGAAARFDAGPEDDVCYVVRGAGVLAAGGERRTLSAGSGFFVAAGEPWSLEAGEELELVSVRVREPLPAAASHAVVDLSAAARGSATAARAFSLGLGPAAGCASVTQFIGYVPPGRAPDHYHHYDEVIYLLEGEGVLHAGGEDAPLAPGSCVHLPARLVHSLENSGPGELALLGVFRPAGSPAEAYYPDGRPAAAPGED